MMWKFCNVLGGLLILLDFTNGGMIPINSPGKGRPKPVPGGGHMSGGNHHTPLSLSPLGNNISSGKPSVASIPSPQSPSQLAAAAPILPPIPPPNAPGPGNYGSSQSALGNTQSQVTYTVSAGGGANPMVVVVQQSINESTAGTTDSGVDLHIPSEVGQHYASDAVSQSLIQPVSGQSDYAQPNANEVPFSVQNEEHPPFDLEAYLAQANYYLPPPTAQVPTSEEVFSEPPKPTEDAVVGFQPDSVMPSSMATPAAVEQVASPQSPAPPQASISVSTSSIQGIGESIVTVTTSSTHGADTVQVLTPQNPTIPEQPLSVTSPSLENIPIASNGGSEETASEPGSDQNAHLESSNQVEPINEEIHTPTPENMSTQDSHVTPTEAGLDGLSPIQPSQNPASSLDVSPIVPSVDENEIQSKPPNNSKPPQPIVPSIEHPVASSPISEMPPSSQPAPVTENLEEPQHEVPPQLSIGIPLNQPPQQSPAIDSPVDSNAISGPPSLDEVHEGEVGPMDSSSLEANAPPENVEMQPLIPIPNDSPPSADPANIILEPTEPNIHNNNEAPPYFSAESSEGGHDAPPSYVLVPLNMLTDTEGTIPISTVPLEHPNHEVEEYDEDYPPFNVEQYLQQAALYLGSQQHGSENLDPELYSPENFQSSVEVHDGETDGVFHIIPAPALLNDGAPTSDEEVHVELMPSIEDMDEHAPVLHAEALHVPVQVQILAAVDSSEADFGSDLSVHYTNSDPYLSPTVVESQLLVSVDPVVSPPHLHLEGVQQDENLIDSKTMIHILNDEPVHNEPQESSHIAPLLEDPSNPNQELSTPEQEPADDVILLNTSALEELEERTDVDANFGQQNFVPVYLIPNLPAENPTEAEGQLDNNAAPISSGNDAERVQWVVRQMPSPTYENPSQERSRPMRPIGSLGMIGRPSTSGAIPMHTYAGNKLNNLMASFPLSEGHYSSSGNGSWANSKNQNNGSFIMHDSRNPQNGMMHIMSNSVFNSHASGDQPSQFTIPVNAASFIMGQKLPFHLTPFESFLPPAPAAPSRPDGSLNLLSSNNNNSDSNADAANDVSNQSSNNMYNNYYNPQDSIRNATNFIQNGMMRPLMSPVFLVFNTNSDQGSHPSQSLNDVKVLPLPPLPQQTSINSSNNVNVISIPDENGTRKETHNGSGNLHLVKRTVTSKSIVSGGNATNSNDKDQIGVPASDQSFDLTDSTSELMMEGTSKVEFVIHLPENTLDAPKQEEESMQVTQEEEVREPGEGSPQSQELQNKQVQKSTPSNTQENEQGQISNPSDTPANENQPIQDPPPQQMPHPRAPSRESGQGGPSLLQMPPAPSPIDIPSVPGLPEAFSVPGLPEILTVPSLPEALTVPGGLAEIAIPDPNFDAPVIPVPDVRIPNIPNTMMDTKGIGKGSGGSKPKPRKKPSQTPAKVPSTPQQTQQPINNPPPPQPQFVPAPPPPQTQQVQQEIVMEQQNSNENEMGQEASYDDSKYEGDEEDEEDMEEGDDERFNESTNEQYYANGWSSLSPAPSTTPEKALPGKYGNGFVGNGRPSVVPSVAAFSAPYINPSAPSSNSFNNPGAAPAPASQQSPDKGCTCSGNNNNNNNNAAANNGGKNKPAPPQSASQVEPEPVPVPVPQVEPEPSNVRPPRPAKPNKRPRPQAGGKKPKPKQKNSEKKTEKLKDSDDMEPGRPTHVKLVAVLNKPNHLEIKEANKEKDSHKAVPTTPNEANKETEKLEAETGEEEEEEEENTPIKFTFVTGDGNGNSRPNGFGGMPIRVTFVTSSNKEDSKSGGPVKVTIQSNPSGPSEKEQPEKVPIKINFISNNSTKSNDTASESQLAPDEQTPSDPDPAPVKQSPPLMTTMNWFGWEIPTLNWKYFTGLFDSFFKKNYRTSSGEFTCDEADEEPTVLRSELDVDYLCGEGHELSRTDVGSQIDSNVCNTFCNSNGFYSGVCMPLKSCLCYLTEERDYAIKLDRLPNYASNNNTEKVSPSLAADDSENSCHNCRCLKSCRSEGKYVGYCSKSCHCGVPWYNQLPDESS